MSNSPSHSLAKIDSPNSNSLPLLPRSFLEEELRQGVCAHRTTSVRPTIFRVLEVFEKEKMGRLTDGRTDGRTDADGYGADAKVGGRREGRKGGRGAHARRRRRRRFVVENK